MLTHHPMRAHRLHSLGGVGRGEATMVPDAEEVGYGAEEGDGGEVE
jgi:hypothetical protein